MSIMSDRIRVIQYGLGPIGRAVARHVVERTGLKLVGGIDIDPLKVGKDLGEVIGLGRALGLVVAESLAQVLAQTEADLVLHTTSSYFQMFNDQIVEILEAGLDVVSTAEELTFPWLAHTEEAIEINDVAKRIGKTVLATGVNPGFLMDSLPLTLTAICQRVDRIDVTRVINATKRRRPFQAKIGSGMTVESFRAKMQASRIGHVGLPESVGMVFDTLGKKLTRYESNIEPMVADRPIRTEHFEVQTGQVRGLKQAARAYTDESMFMSLTFIAALGEGDDGDTIKITGEPDLEIKLKGTNGDIATVAIAVNAIRRVREAAPGLVTMRDLPIVTLW
ncbi:MAG: dihydrodipicolinate reductase [Proteobacteria bacterium]|nr:dihydrodipicolinate reductase [Pseudomonadota bacterium]